MATIFELVSKKEKCLTPKLEMTKTQDTWLDKLTFHLKWK